MSSNPFFFGNPVSPAQFFDRRREIRRITSRIVNQGQSSAVVGEPRTGKTSLLFYLAAPETRQALYGEQAKSLLFSFLDAQGLGMKFDQAQFWNAALQPFEEQVVAPDPDSLLAQTYKTCHENNYGAFVLERLLAQMSAANWRLVLMVDEFNDLLHHPILNSAEFFGSLRSLATRSRGALALVIASRRSLETLNKDTQEFSRTGSPYFNFFDEIILGPLSDRDVADLLNAAGDRFTDEDRRFVVNVTGCHACLTQITASALWEAYDSGSANAEQRRTEAGQRTYDDASRTLSDIWRLWSPAMRKSFAGIALANIPHLLQARDFNVEQLTQDFRDFGPEMRTLAKQGFVAEDSALPGGWRVRTQAFLWWLTDELTRTVRDEVAFDEWLKAQEWEGLLTHNEKQQLNKTVGVVIGMLKNGVATLIEAAAKGAGAALVGK
jgi:hypothetical protein